MFCHHYLSLKLIFMHHRIKIPLWVCRIKKGMEEDYLLDSTFFSTWCLRQNWAGSVHPGHRRSRWALSWVALLFNWLWLPSFGIAMSSSISCCLRPRQFLSWMQWVFKLCIQCSLMPWYRTEKTMYSTLQSRGVSSGFGEFSVVIPSRTCFWLLFYSTNFGISFEASNGLASLLSLL